MSGCPVCRALPDFFEFISCFTSCGIRKYITKRHSFKSSHLGTSHFKFQLLCQCHAVGKKFTFTKTVPWSWRMAQEIQALCSCRGPGLGSQHSHGSTLPSVTPVPGALMPSSDLFGQQAHKWYTYKQTTQTHKINKSFFKFLNKTVVLRVGKQEPQERNPSSSKVGSQGIQPGIKGTVFLLLNHLTFLFWFSGRN